jgi:hypothetical protein
MAKRLNESKTAARDTVGDRARNELMKDCLRKAEQIPRSLEGRKHTDSTILIAEDRTRQRFI